LCRKSHCNHFLRVCHARVWVIGCFSLALIGPARQKIGGAANATAAVVPQRSGKAHSLAAWRRILSPIRARRMGAAGPSYAGCAERHSAHVRFVFPLPVPPGVIAVTHHNLERRVASATGESLREIGRRGYSLADPRDVCFDPEPELLTPQAIDWDAAAACRSREGESNGSPRSLASKTSATRSARTAARRNGIA